MKRWFGCFVAASALATGGASGCFKSKEPERHGSVWRASNDYGDKPGNGIELVISEQGISGRFFI